MSPSPSLAPGKSYCLENLLSGSHPDLQHSPSAHLAHTKNKLYSHDNMIVMITMDIIKKLHVARFTYLIR